MRSNRHHRARVGLAVTFLACSCAAFAQAQEAPASPDPALRGYLSANGMLARGMNDLAAQEYRRFLAEQPNHARAPHARYGLAVALFRLHQHADAALQLDGLVDLRNFEFAAESGFLLAQCRLAAGQPAEAAAPLERLLKSHPKHALAGQAAALLVEANYRAKNYKNAIAAADDFQSRQPESKHCDRAEYFAGLSLISLNDEAAASSRLAKLSTSWPESPLAGQALLLAAQCAHRAGSAAAARKYYETLLARDQGDLKAEALLGLAALDHADQRLEDAKAGLDRLLKEHRQSGQAASAYLARGRVLFDMARFDDARTDFDRYAKSKDADRAQAAYWLARCDLRRGRAAQAAGLLESAIKDNPESELRPALLLEFAAAQIEAGHDEQAAETLIMLRRQHADHALASDATEMLASLHHRQGRYDQSQSLCEEYLERFPKNPATPRIELLFAENALLSGELTGAERAYREFLARHPKDANAALAGFRLGCVHFRLDQHDRARPLLAEAAGLAQDQPVFRPALLYLGDIAFRAERWREAAELFGRYAAFRPTSAAADEALLKQGIALYKLGEFAPAANAYARLLKEHPASPHRPLASFELARTQLASGDAKAAEEGFRKLARSSDKPVSAMANAQLAALASERGDLEQAAKLYLAASETGDARNAPDALHSLGNVLLAAGRYAEAVSAFDKLLSEHPSHPRVAETRARRALALARIGHAPESLRELTAARAVEGIDPQLRDALNYEETACLRTLGRSEDADKALRALIASAAQPAMRIHAGLDLARADLGAERFENAAATLRNLQPLLADPNISPQLREQSQYQLAAVEFRMGRAQQAADLFMAFLKDHPQSALAPSASLLAAECLVRMTQHARAVEYLNAALENKTGSLSDTEMQTARLRLGECLAATQDWAGSELAFAAFLERHSASDLGFQARFGKGWAAENQGRHADAIAEYGKVTASHQGPTAARAQFQIGECLFAQGRHEEAVRELLKVDILYAYPEWSAAALYEAGRCFEAMKKPEQAAEQFRAVREKHADTSWGKLAAQRLSAISSATTSPTPANR